MKPRRSGNRTVGSAVTAYILADPLGWLRASKADRVIPTSLNMKFPVMPKWRSKK
jgi:hypothetical protein